MAKLNWEKLNRQESYRKALKAEEKRKRAKRLKRWNTRLKKKNRTGGQIQAARDIKCRQLDRNSKRYWSWRYRVFKRDDFSCQECGVRGREIKLEVDHIQSWFDFPALRFVLSNGRTLCKPCHSDKHPWRRKKDKKLQKAIRRNQQQARTYLRKLKVDMNES